LSAASGRTVAVNYATADGTATAPSDYVAIPTTTLTFSPGQTTKTITVPVNGDLVDETDETFTVNLSNPTNATLSTATGTGTIIDDDPPPTVTLSLSGSPMAEAGGVATVTANLSAVSGQTVTVNLGFSGTATGGGVDYTRSTNSIVIPPGSLSGSATLTAAQDTLDENDETIIVDITAIGNGTESGNQQVTAIITDDDPPPAVAFNAPSSGGS